jgi:ketosteroid isomerase-like protein
MCTAILIGGGLGIGLTHARIADAKEDPEGVVRGFVAALNNGDVANGSALLDDDVTLFEPNGDGSFGVVGKKAFVSILADITSSGFHATVRHTEVHGDTVNAIMATSDDTTKGAGVDRYLERFTVRVVAGKIASFDILFDTSDAETNKYLDYLRSQSGDEGSPPGTIEVTLGPGANGSQPGKAFVAGAGEGVSSVAVQVQPGQAGAQQSAHLHSGSCAARGETVFPLAAVVDGSSFTIISASVDEILGQGLSLDVHQVGQSDRVNTCGAVQAAAVAPAPPAPAPLSPTIKPPATGAGPAPDDGLPSLLLAAIVATGVFAVMAGLGIRSGQPR